MDVAGTVAVVTGGSGGLGGRICRALSKAGAHVVVVYNESREIAGTLAEELSSQGPRAIAIQADVTTPEGISRLVDTPLDAFGRIDVLVNDAAYAAGLGIQDLERLDPAEWRKTLEADLTAPYLAMRAVAGPMRANGKGRIVNISAVGGLFPFGNMAYSVSKAALIHLTKCMAVALAPDILVNCVAPGHLEGTRMTARMLPELREIGKRAPVLGRVATEEDVADAVLMMVRTDSITGQTLVVDCGRFFH